MKTTENTKAKQILEAPKVGDAVLVNYGGDGNGKIVGITPDIGYITAIYIGGDVRIGNGDVYQVQRISHKDANWGTVRPKKQQRFSDTEG